MKNQLITIAAIIFAVPVFIGCGGSQSKDTLVKKWQISELKIDGFDEQMAQMRASADTTKDSIMKEQFISQINMYQGYMDEMKKSTLEYKVDGSFEANTMMMGQAQNVKGTWTMSDDGKKVIIVDEKQKADTMNVDELTNEKFVTTSINSGKRSTVILVPAK